MEAIYFNKKLYHHLKTFLPVFAERVTAAGKVVKKHLPTIQSDQVTNPFKTTVP